MLKIDFSKVVTAEAGAAAALDRAQTEAAARLTALFEAAGAALLDGVPRVEQLAWPARESAARAVLAGAATPLQAELLAREAKMTAEPVEVLAAAVVAEAEAFQRAAARLTGLRRAASAALADSATPGAVEELLDAVAAKLAEG